MHIPSNREWAHLLGVAQSHIRNTNGSTAKAEGIQSEWHKWSTRLPLKIIRGWKPLQINVTGVTVLVSKVGEGLLLEQLVFSEIEGWGRRRRGNVSLLNSFNRRVGARHFDSLKLSGDPLDLHAGDGILLIQPVVSCPLWVASIIPQGIKAKPAWAGIKAVTISWLLPSKWGLHGPLIHSKGGNAVYWGPQLDSDVVARGTGNGVVIGHPVIRSALRAPDSRRHTPGRVVSSPLDFIRRWNHLSISRSLGHFII